MTDAGRKSNDIEGIKEYRRRFYDIRADVYDEEQMSDEDFQRELEGFRNLVNVEEGDLVLDIATGTGTYLIEMVKKGAICYGLDISPRMLEKLRQKAAASRIKAYVKDVRVGEADKLPYPNKFFDWVTCIGMLEYYPMEYARAALEEVKRVLKFRGKCFIDIPNSSMKEAQERDYVYRYDAKLFESIVTSLGFEVSAKNTAGWMIQYLLRLSVC